MRDNEASCFETTPVVNRLTVNQCGQQACTEGYSFGPAVRTHYLIHFVLAGEGYYICDKIKYTLHEGEGFVIFPGRTTFYQAGSRNPWSYVWFGFSGDDAEAIVRSCNFSDTSLIFRSSAPARLKYSARHLLDSFQRTPRNQYEVLASFYECIANIYTSRLPLRPDTQLPLEQLYYQKAVQYVQEHFSSNISVASMASFIGIDRSYLYKLFMKSGNISPQQFIISYRLKIAAYLIKEENLSITEAAFTCGFQSLSLFFRHFKKHFGVSPRVYKSNSMISDMENQQDFTEWPFISKKAVDVSSQWK